MARTITEIFDDKMQRVAADAVLGPLLTSTSKTAIYRLIMYISAVCDFTLEKLHDIFKAEVNETIAAMKPHSLRWYALKAKAFQYGFNLVPEADYYDNTGIAEDAIEVSKIVDHAAVIEQERELRLKVATDNGQDLEALTAEQLNAFVAYMQRVKDAGVKLSITSTPADLLKVGLRIKYNALVLNGYGGRIDGVSATPVQNAIRTFLKNLPFNGVFSIQKMVDVIQAVDGVDDVKADVVQTTYGALPFTSVDIDYTPDSGYLRVLDADLTIQFIAA
jgi:hypothetical protein